MEDVYYRLGLYLSNMYCGWNLPSLKTLESILRHNFDPVEAEVALALPNDLIPLETVTLEDIAPKITTIPAKKLKEVLENLVSRGLLFSGKTRNGKQGYALLRDGYGWTQTFFWKGEKSAFSERMADLLWQHHFPVAKVKQDNMFPNATKHYRFVPSSESMHEHELAHVHGSTLGREAVYPFEMIQEIVRKAKVVAVAHCACRMKMHLGTGVNCGHPSEVCLKFDDLADHMINVGLGRKLSVDEAIDIVDRSEEAGLVHFVENSREGIKHNCNCCGCACWSVGAIRRKLAPRDVIMAVYFSRETDRDSCVGCGACASICPVNAVTIDDYKANVDNGLCIGCGVCVLRCPNSAIKIVRRVGTRPPRDFEELHQKIMMEKGFGVLTHA